MSAGADAEQWYFAYGSNLWIDQMIARTGPVDRGLPPSRIARLANYRLVFQSLSSDGQSFANIIRAEEEVLGAAYCCAPGALAKLDCYERGYERRPVIVTDDCGQRLPAVAYVMLAEHGAKFGRPSSQYLWKIITGARQHGLPEAYIATMVARADFANPTPGTGSAW